MYLTDSCDRGLGGANIASCPTYIVSFVYFSCWVYLDFWEELGGGELAGPSLPPSQANHKA